MQAITDNEKDLLIKFRRATVDLYKLNHDDFYLVKWLRARNYDLKKSEDMYRKSMRWRTEVGADTVLETFEMPEVLKIYYPGGLFCATKTGLPVWIDPLGHLDMKGLFSSVKRADIVQSMVYRLEFLYSEFRRQTELQEKQIDMCVHILDMDGFGSKHLMKSALDTYKEILRIMDSNYPETLKTTYIINAPKLFHLAFNFLKKFLSESTTKKFKMLDNTWKEELLQVIDADQLPVHYGGTLCDPDGDTRCSSRLCYGGTIPEEYYRSHKGTGFTEEYKPTTITVNRGSKVKLNYNVTSLSTEIRWLFSTEDGSISFGIYRRPPPPTPASGPPPHRNSIKGHKGNKEYVKTVQKYDSHLEPQDGLLVCDKIGVYTVVFDNSSSILMSRTLIFNIEVVDQTEIREEAEGQNK